MTGARVLAECAHLGTPVLVRGQGALPHAWQAADWSVEALRRRIGHVRLPVEPFPYAARSASPPRNEGAHSATIAELLAPHGPHSIFACPAGAAAAAEPLGVFRRLRDDDDDSDIEEPSWTPAGRQSASGSKSAAHGRSQGPLPSTLQDRTAAAADDDSGAPPETLLHGSAALRAEWALPAYLRTLEAVAGEDGTGPREPLRPAGTPSSSADALFRNGTVQFYLGPPGSGSQPHWHTAAWNGLLRGRKRWLLWPPERASYAHQHVAHTASAAIESAGAPLVCEQRAGDVLLVPPLWGHATFNLEPVLGFATELPAAERARAGMRSRG